MISALAGAGAKPLAGPLTGGAGVSDGGYVTTATDFDGSNDSLSRGADLTGNSDVDKMLMSFSYRRDVEGNNTVYTNALTTVKMRFNGTSVNMTIKAAGGGNMIDFTAGTAIADGWGHFLLSLNTSDPVSTNNWCVCHLSGVEIFLIENLNQGLIDSASTDHLIGELLGGQFYNGCLAELVLDYGNTIDTRIEANRRKFTDSNGKPINLGADGSTPTGVQPLVYFDDLLGANKGSGGTFAINGVPVLCSTSPTDPPPALFGPEFGPEFG